MKQDYKTSDQGLAAYLLLLGYQCVGAVPVEGDGVRKDFFFVDVEEPAKLAQEYMENKAVGKLQAYRKKLQFLNHIIRTEALDEAKVKELKGE